MLRWVEEYGPNIALRLAWVNVLVITEVRATRIPARRALVRPSLAVLHCEHICLQSTNGGTSAFPHLSPLCMLPMAGCYQLSLFTVTLQPALVAEVLHSNEVDKVREAYDSVSVVRSAPPLALRNARMHCWTATFLVSGSTTAFFVKLCPGYLRAWRGLSFVVDAFVSLGRGSCCCDGQSEQADKAFRPTHDFRHRDACR